jgi:3-hydroxyacyl-[acyl-carrier-protein] dehydratase
MRFSLIDRIDELEPGVRIAAVKNLSMAEEYLQDHFPQFPVMPGVLMLEAMTQTGAWLVRASEDFQHSMVVLKEAKNVKYGQFVEPGQTLKVVAEIIEQGERESILKTRGTIGERATVSGRLILTRYNLADQNPAESRADELVKKELRALFALLWRPSGDGVPRPVEAAGS